MFAASASAQYVPVPFNKGATGSAIALVGTGCSANGTSSTSTGGCQSNGGTGLTVTFTYNGAVAGNALFVFGNANCGGTALTLTYRKIKILCLTYRKIKILCLKSLTTL